MMSGDSVHYSVGHAIFFGELRTDFSVLAFDFVSNGLADVMEKRGGFSNTFFGADFFGNHAGNMCHFNRMQ